ncbi:MAG: hypothetical protein ACLTYN_13325 [Dysosmobacter welbionis]
MDAILAKRDWAPDHRCPGGHRRGAGLHCRGGLSRGGGDHAGHSWAG